MTKIFNRKYQKQQRQDLRNNMTSVEIILWTKLKNRQLMGHQFRRQYGIERYVVDFFCTELKLAIELDGGIHAQEHVIENDTSRQNYIESLGIKVIRYSNDDIKENLNGVLIKLKETIKNINSTSIK